MALSIWIFCLYCFEYCLFGYWLTLTVKIKEYCASVVKYVDESLSDGLHENVNLWITEFWHVELCAKVIYKCICEALPITQMKYYIVYTMHKTDKSLVIFINLFKSYLPVMFLYWLNLWILLLHIVCTGSWLNNYTTWPMV